MMQLSLLMHTQLSATPSTLLLFPSSVRRRGRRRALHAGCSTPFLPSTVGFKTQQRCCHSLHPHYNGVLVKATLLESPVMWVGRLCIFYALLKTGIAGSPSSPLLYDSGDDGSSGDMGFSKWLEEAFKGNSEEKEAADRRKLVSKWHVTTKGTLKRSYRVPSRSQGQKLLKGIASLLSEDDHFLDAASHKGCRIRRESAHGESVCCNNVRALFDEIPTPHLVVEITAFPSGRLTEGDYTKAEKLERVLRSGSSI